MKILIVSQYFPPEVGAPAARIAEIAAAWRELGDDVRVLTGFPNHPRGRVFPGYRARIWRGFCRDLHRGVPVYRTWLFPAANSGTWLRAGNYASFCASAAATGACLRFRPDIVIGTSPQILCALAARGIARVKRARFIFEVRDIWPESLAAVSAASESALIYRGIAAIADRLYRAADRVTVVSPAFIPELEARGVPREKIETVLAGYSPRLFHPAAQPADRALLGARNGDFLVAYIGTIGMAHGTDILLDAAERLRGEAGIRFAIVGDGAGRHRLQRDLERRGLNNVALLGAKTWAEIPGLLAACDAVLVTLRDAPLFARVIPTKMLEAMAVGRPLILAVRGQARQMLHQAGAGLAISPGSVDELVQATLALRSNPPLAVAMGQCGAAFVREHHGFPALARHYSQLAASLVQPHPAGEPLAKTTTSTPGI